MQGLSVKPRAVGPLSATHACGRAHVAGTFFGDVAGVRVMLCDSMSFVCVRCCICGDLVSSVLRWVLLSLQGKSVRSFPSGHSSESMAGTFYVTLLCWCDLWRYAAARKGWRRSLLVSVVVCATAVMVVVV